MAANAATQATAESSLDMIMGGSGLTAAIKSDACGAGKRSDIGIEGRALSFKFDRYP